MIKQVLNYFSFVFSDLKGIFSEQVEQAEYNDHYTGLHNDNEASSSLLICCTIIIIISNEYM